MTSTASESIQEVVDHPAGCPVFHQDFSEAKPIGCHWALADRLREQGPLYYNEFAKGYWVFTRHDAVRDIYKNPEIFSSESITPSSIRSTSGPGGSIPSASGTSKASWWAMSLLIGGQAPPRRDA